MNIDPQRIDQLIALIASGQLDSRQAARELLLAPPPAPAAARRETLEALIRRLGMPPPPIQHDWQRQLRELAQTWQRVHRRPLHSVRLCDLLVDDQNQLSFAPGVLDPGVFDPSVLSPPTGQAAAELDGAAAEPERAAEPCQSPPRADPATTQRPVIRPRQQRRVLVGGMLAGSAALAALGIYQYRTPQVVLAIPAAPAPANAFSPRSGAGTAAAQPPLPRSPATLGPASPAADRAQQRAELRRRDLGLDNPLLAGSLSAAERATGSDDNAVLAASPHDADLGGDSPHSANPAGTASGNAQLDPARVALEHTHQLDPEHSRDPSAMWQDADTEVDEAADSSDPSPDLEPSDRPTVSAAPAEALTLPPLPSADEPSQPHLLIAAQVAELRWEFPVPTTIALQSRTAASWVLIDTADATELALLESGDEGLRFEWSAAAASNPEARRIAAGRLVLSTPAGQGRTLWLRPQLRSQPLQIDFSSAHAAAAWPLQGPPLSGAGRLHVEVSADESIEQSWVQPADAHELRRNVSILQWTPRGAAVPAIRCRLELRVAARLSAKLRYAVQLDESAPWQHFSAPQLTAARDQVSLTLNRLLLEQSEMTRQYSAATTQGRRMLKPRKDALDHNVAALQTLLQRLQQLDSLQATLASSAEICIKLTAQWPDAEQTILKLTSEQ